MERLHVGRVVVDRTRQVYRHGQHVFRPEPRVDGAHAQEALQHQSGAAQQHERQRYLRDHQGPAQSFTPRRQCATALVQGRAQRTAGRLKCRRESE